MNSIEDSIVAINGSTIKHAQIDKSVNIQKIKKKSFLKGFFTGIIASLTASLIWFFLKPLIIALIGIQI